MLCAFESYLLAVFLGRLGLEMQKWVEKPSVFQRSDAKTHDSKKEDR